MDYLVHKTLRGEERPGRPLLESRVLGAHAIQATFDTARNGRRRPLPPT